MCGGLFTQDLSDDCIDEKSGDMAALCLWHCITDEQLEDVLANVSTRHIANQREHAKSLIRWCLAGNPAQRPTLKQILSHAFFDSIDDISPELHGDKVHFPSPRPLYRTSLAACLPRGV